MQSADLAKGMLDQWHPASEDVRTLTLDGIYQELYGLDTFEQSINPKPVKKEQDEDSGDDTNAAENSKEVQVQNDPEEARKSSILQDLNTRRIALRARAMELSRAKIRPLTVLDLPVDILCKILDYFQDVRIKEQGQINWGHWRKSADEKICRKTIQNARLVSRRFNDLASPLLCPIVWVDIEQESLDKVEELSRCPRVAQGVRGIVVGLQYRPQELATDLARFKDYCKEQLEEMNASCGYDAETWQLGGYDSDDETVCELPLRVYREAMNNYRDIRLSWDADLPPIKI